MAGAITCKAHWARHLVREKLRLEINALESRNGEYTPALPLPVGDVLWTHDRLPPDDQLPDDEEAYKLQSPDTKAETFPERRVCIVGAGIAGLYISMILDDLAIPGLTYDILEASSRVGGRVYTHHFSDTPHDYYDIGAMRYPKIPSMDRVFTLFKRTEVPLIPYYLEGGDVCPNLFNDRLFIPGVEDPYHVSVKNGGSVPNHVVDNASDLLDKAFDPYKEELAKNFEDGFRKLLIVDDFSTREYLKRGGPEGHEPQYDFFSIQWMETLNTSSGLFDQAFSESVIDSFDFNYPEKKKKKVDWFCIEGGTSLVVDAIVKGMKTKVQTNKRVEAITIDKDNGSEGNMAVKCVGESSARTGYSTVFSTTTLGCLARMDLRQLDLHPSQKDAIRALHYDDSAKVALKFRYPWWVVDCKITQGGVASTDLPIRTCVYPSYNLHDGNNKEAVLLASYTWAQDATRIGSLIGGTQTPPSEEELVELILQDLARLHAGSDMTYEKIKGAYTGIYHAFSWSHDPFTSGAFALFGPGQFRNLYPYLSRPTAQAKFHIVGEASSAHHAWIAGALDSACAAVYRFLRRFQLWPYMRLLEKKWNLPGEVEPGRDGTVHLQNFLGMLAKGQHVKV